MRLKELRKLNNKNQTEIAKLLNVTQQTYARYESEINEPTIDTLCKLADYYSVSVDYLVGRDFNNKYGYLSDNEKVLLDNFRQLNDINQIKLIAQSDGLLVGQK